MALKQLKLTRSLQVAAGHGRLEGDKVVLTGAAYAAQGRYSFYVVFKTADGSDLWLNTFTKTRQSPENEDVNVPNDTFLNVVFSECNKPTAEEQVNGFCKGLEALGFTKTQLEKFKKGVFDEGTPVQLELIWHRISANGATYYSVTKAS